MSAKSLMVLMLLVAPAAHAEMPCMSFYREIYEGITSEPKVYYTYQSEGQQGVSCSIESTEDATPAATAGDLVMQVLRTKRNAQIYAINSRTVDPADYAPSRLGVTYEGPAGIAPAPSPQRVSYTQDGPSPTSQSRPRRQPKAKSSGPGWGEILLGGVSQVAGAYAARKGGQVYVPPSGAKAYMPSSATASRSSYSGRAPLAPAACATYQTQRYEPTLDSAVVEWRNSCGFPIEVNWCWVSPGQSRCKTDNASPTIRPGGTAMAIGPTGERNPTASYYVCDMSDDGLCAGHD